MHLKIKIKFYFFPTNLRFQSPCSGSDLLLTFSLKNVLARSRSSQEVKLLIFLLFCWRVSECQLSAMLCFREFDPKDHKSTPRHRYNKTLRIVEQKNYNFTVISKFRPTFARHSKNWGLSYDSKV